MWQIIGDCKVQKYRPSSDKELEESPNLKWRKIIPIVSIAFCHDVGRSEFRASAFIRREKERVGGKLRVVSEKWMFALKTPVEVQARGTESGPWSKERFLQKMTERFGAEFASRILFHLEQGISSVEDERPAPPEPRTPVTVSPDVASRWAEIKARKMGWK